MGQIYVPTGGGKTVIMMEDCARLMRRATKKMTIVVVAPRILLANQLCEEFREYAGVMRPDVIMGHVHSGETKHFKSTKPERIAMFDAMCQEADAHRIIFTTYHSLNRIVESGINIDCIYYDEAHNSVQKSFFKSIWAVAQFCDNRYYFTATPRISHKHDRGMNNVAVYGEVLCNVPAPELIENGSIVGPKIVPFKTDFERVKSMAHHCDANTVTDILDSLDESHAAKVLVAAPNTRVLWNMISQTDLLSELQERGYEILHITSKHGAYVNKTKVNREQFFQTLHEYGMDDNKKFVLFHYSILAEGINCPGLTHTILLRNLNLVEMAQTIGRVIRVNRDDAKDIASGKIPAGQCQFYRKPFGTVTVPIHSNYGNAIATRLQILSSSRVCHLRHWSNPLDGDSILCNTIRVKGITP